MRKILYILLGLAFSNGVFAQCGTDEYNRRLVQDKLQNGEHYVDYLERTKGFKTEEGYNHKTKKAIRTIPVVFHVVHDYGESNISKTQIEDQLRIINEDFQRLNADRTQTRTEFQSIASDFEIEFKLARKAPDGSCTEGITRTYDPLNTYEDYEDFDNEVKAAVTPWNSQYYLNIWVVTEIMSPSSPGNILGYAQFPGQGSTTDGIVIRHDRVGTIGTANATDKGRTLTHEIGHWLGLYHTFQGGCRSTNQTDRVSDTPPVKEASFGCTTSQNPNTCSNDFPNKVDNVENYMDYTDGRCMNMFTNGQKARVDAFLATNSGRGRNISSSSMTATAVNTNPNCGPIADFWYSSDRTIICAGGSIDFSGLSYNATTINRSWAFEGGTPARSSTQNPTITYNTPGVYKVELTASNTGGSTKKTQEQFITVLPAIATRQAPYSQDFENSSAFDSWDLDADVFGYGWENNKTKGYSGNNSLEMVIDASAPLSQRYSAIMPPVDLSTHSGPVSLHFRCAYARRVSSATELLLILISENCGQTWRTLKAYNGTKLSTGSTSPNWKPSVASDWANKEIDLSSYSSNNNLLIRFDVIAKSGNSVFIDDINIGSDPLSIPSFESDLSLTLIPNPAKNTVAIKMRENTNDATVSIVDITGRLLLQQNLDPASRMINTSKLANGVYTLTVTGNNKKWSKKLIISK